MRIGCGCAGGPLVGAGRLSDDFGGPAVSAGAGACSVDRLREEVGSDQRIMRFSLGAFYLLIRRSTQELCQLVSRGLDSQRAMKNTPGKHKTNHPGVFS